MNRRFLLQNIFLRNFRKHELKDLKPHVFFCRYYTILSHQLSTPNQYFLSQKNIKIQPFYTNCFLKRAHHHHECIRKLDCWQCGKEINAELEQFFCECGVLQPPITTRSYFQIFGLPESFDIDMQKLKIGLQGLQLLLHPDKCANKSKIEKKYAEEHSAIVNEAYSTLQNPLTRGLYLLHIDPKNNQLESEIDIGKDFLGSMLDLNEDIEECTDEKSLMVVEKKLNKEISGLVDEISGNFKSSDNENAKKNLAMLKYLNSASNRIKDIKREKHYDT